MATLEQIQAKVKKLQLQADALLAKKTQAAVDQIRALMRKHGLTTEDIETNAKATREAKAPKGNASSGKTKVVGSVKAKKAPKYRHPKTGATWTGHGRAPAWIAEVKDRTRFLIEGVTDAAPPASVGAVSKAKTAVREASASIGATSLKGQPKGPQPAKYRDPKSGATWSGRGPAPAWLAGTKERSKFLIDGAGAGPM
ncbi:H-NS family nucleoid-associated regulatory protein [Paraburkholderia sediminicola]|uniref:H-NS family nucleoid-associated regulatory protein n=1 Tax=Paraburkholderia sediminicola TaxID=458836 RepID=UPI0038BB5C95